MMQLYHDKPKSQGVENALKRAKQLVEIEWIPVRSFPGGLNSAIPSGAKALDIWLPAYRPQKGMAYSSARIHEKFLGFNVSFETFMTALNNPNSVLYTRPLHGMGTNMFSYYGIVCSCFASYVCGFPYRINTSRMAVHDGVTKVDATRLENLELCDLVLNPGDHVAVITDIQRDVDGNIHMITVAESTKPVCISRNYTPDLFRKYWLEQGYDIYRYEGVHKQTYEPMPYVHVEGDPYLELPPVNRTFMSNFGDKANIVVGEGVEFSVFEEGWETIAITAPDGVVTAIPIRDSKAACSPEQPGFYTAVCRRGEEVSQTVTFCATNSEVVTNVKTVTRGGCMELAFRNPAPDAPILYLINTPQHGERQRGYLTAEEEAAGKASITINVEPGEYYVCSVSRNKYGYYLSGHSYFQVV